MIELQGKYTNAKIYADTIEDGVYSQVYDIINCKAFAKTAEILAQYVFKGQQLAVTGHIQTGKYKNKAGKDVYTTEVIVDSFNFVSQGNKGQAKNKKDNSLEGLEEIEVLDEGEIPF